MLLVCCWYVFGMCLVCLWFVCYVFWVFVFVSEMTHYIILTFSAPDPSCGGYIIIYSVI
jgi:hypothetical protein